MISPARGAGLKALAPKSEPAGSPAEVTSSTPVLGPHSGSASSASSHALNSFVSRGRKRMAFHHPVHGYAIPPPQPAKVARRNQRERNRVKQVNCGFELLRNHIPTAAKAKKMSKVETLKHAVDYIQNLQRMLVEQQSQNQSAHAHTPSPTTPPPSGQNQFYDQHNHSQHQSDFSGASYPPQSQTPVTPITPRSTSTEGTHYPFNESGYETASSSSFYTIHGGGAHPDHAHGHAHLGYSPISPTGGSSPPPQASHYPTQGYPAQTQLPQQGYYDDIAATEEDELLDVIAKWQEQED